MKRYKEYKDSGVEWIGEIPSHWGKSKIKHVASIFGRIGFRGYTVEDIVDEGEGAITLSPSNILNQRIVLDKKTYLSWKKYEESPEIKIYNGDIIFVKTASVGKVAYVENLDEYATLNPQLIVFKNIKINNKYLYYNLISNVIQSEINKGSSGSVLPTLTQNEIGNYKLMLPPDNEQGKIVDYIDEKTSQIENLISKKEELIETLKASRTKLISETVSKGLDKDVPMKDSGVEWIGEIPKHYEVKKLRYLGDLQNGISKGAEEFGFGYPFVSYGDVYKNSRIPNKIEGLVNSSKQDRRIYSVTEGDVFFTRTSETIEEIGFASTCLETIQGATFAGFLIRFRANNNDLYKGYSKYYFRSNMHRKFFVKEMNLVTRASLGQSLLKNLPVVIPSYGEQIEISKYLDKQVTIINNSISKIEEQIELLKKAKQKLITEVVTGKIDVTNL